MARRIAVASRHDAMILTTREEQTISVQDARDRGYTIVDPYARKPTAKASTTPPPVSTTTVAALCYAATLRGLPEAINRPAATAALAETYDLASLPAHKAAALLRGLPLETNTIEDDTTMTEAPNYKLTRKLELHVAALAYNGSRGNETAGRQAEQLKSALRLHREGGVSLNSALAAVGYSDVRGLANMLAS